MKAIQILIAIALAVMAYIFLRFVIKRIWLLTVLRKFAKKHNYICKIPLSCLLPANRSTSPVKMETGNAVYNIKLFGLLRKHCEIHFWSLKEYSVEWYFSRYGFVGTTPIGQLGARRRSLGNGKWSVGNGKAVVPVLLLSPAHAPVRLTRTDVNHLVDLRAGDKMGDTVFADLDYLLRFIEKNEK
ncbi:MAG: hypothetical protein IJX37_01245 [Oscillospiraceae bacterium]|nr:hypothetical protein [Oscillospiraceae bacterium]